MEMKNENFEKKENATNDIPVYWSNKDVWILGYNTCLDRTNAKMTAIKAKKLIEHYRQEPEDGFSKVNWEVGLCHLINELETELKKAEQWK